MKYIDEFRNPIHAINILKQIDAIWTKPHMIMEICGGQTHTIMKYGIDQLLAGKVELIHGPGCPVCVTPIESIDNALYIASLPDVIFTSFGDMLRVPGSHNDLLNLRSQGADIRIVYSPLESLQIARKNPDKQVVFFAIGFETTAPGNAMTIFQAKKEGLSNYSVLVSHVLVPPALQYILSAPSNRVQGILAAGHVCTINGWKEYETITQKYHVPIVPTGFEPIDILDGIYKVIKQLESGDSYIDNQYLRSVHKEGNIHAQEIVHQVFDVCDQKWRGLGVIPASGMKIRQEYSDFDAELRFEYKDISSYESSECISSLILQGLKKPSMCAVFAKECTPSHPLGAPMVSGEGVCSAYYKYQRIVGSEKIEVMCDQ